MAAAAVRIAVASTLWDLPLVRTPKLDSFELLAWAQRLTSGDWTWPAVAQHGPGYPIVLAGLLTIGGGSLKTVMVLQALMGASTAVLVALCAKRLFSRRAGLFAGLIYAFYGPAAYIDTAILTEGLLLFLLAIALWALAVDAMTVRRAAIAGAAFGAAALVRPTALIIAAAVVVSLLATRRSLLVAFVAACAVVLMPALAKSWATSGSLSIQGYGGLNAYIGNSPQHDGRATFRLGAGWDALNSEAPRAGILDAAAQDRYYLAKTWREVTAQPLAFARLLASKTLWLVQSEESRDSHSFYFFTEQSVLLRILPRWWLLFPLAIVGFAANRRATLLMPYMAGAAVSVILLVVGFRYRMPFVLGLTVLAGAGLGHIVSAAAERRRRELAVAGGLAAAALATSMVLLDPRNTNVAEEWAFTGSSLITEHRLDDAEAAYRRALQLDPQSGLAWDGLGLTLYNGGRLADARLAFERASAIDRDNSRAAYHLALVDGREGKLADAVAGYRRALTLSPGDSAIVQDLVAVQRKRATELGMAGRTREALEAMREVVALAPRDGEAWLDVCLLSMDLHDREGAVSALQHARDLGADPARMQFASQAMARAAWNR